jgi:hypothetical protein
LKSSTNPLDDAGAMVDEPGVSLVDVGGDVAVGVEVDVDVDVARSVVVV